MADIEDMGEKKLERLAAEAASDVEKRCAPDKMSKHDAVEFLSMIEEQLETARETLEEELEEEEEDDDEEDDEED